jgi:hypothetical protein
MYFAVHPELSFHEDETAKYIAEFYKGKDVEVETNVGPRGIKVTIDSGIRFYFYIFTFVKFSDVFRRFILMKR